MFEPQIQAIEAEVGKLLAQFANQGLAAQVNTTGLRMAVAALRNVLAANKPSPAPVFKPGEKPILTVPPDAAFFPKEAPVKPAPSNE